MGTSDEACEILRRRKSRAIRAILTEKERVADTLLDQDESDALRRVVMNELNDVVALAETLLASVSEGNRELNELFFLKVDEIHAQVCK